MKDKILALLGAALLGYYLAISVFRHTIWKIFGKTLPPINDRHLPEIYIGLFGLSIAVFTVYLFYTFFIEKKSFKEYKSRYLIAFLALVSVPLLIIGAFRVHSVSYVAKVESTPQTDIRIHLEDNSAIWFETSPGSAIGCTKSLAVPEKDLEKVGKMINELNVVNDIQEQKGFNEKTLFINYTYKGKWYSKILSYENGFFKEQLSSNKVIHYKGESLEKYLEDLEKAAKDIKIYTSAKIMHSKYLEDTENEKLNVSRENFSQLVSFIRPENKITPSPEIEKVLKRGNEENWVKKSETNIFGFQLFEDENRGGIENFIVYDNYSKILLFEGTFYKGDLSEILAEI